MLGKRLLLLFISLLTLVHCGRDSQVKVTEERIFPYPLPASVPTPTRTRGLPRTMEIEDFGVYRSAERPTIVFPRVSEEERKPRASLNIAIIDEGRQRLRQKLLSGMHLKECSRFRSDGLTEPLFIVSFKEEARKKGAASFGFRLISRQREGRAAFRGDQGASKMLVSIDSDSGLVPGEHPTYQSMERAHFALSAPMISDCELEMRIVSSGSAKAQRLRGTFSCRRLINSDGAAIDVQGTFDCGLHTYEAMPWNLD